MEQAYTVITNGISMKLEKNLLIDIINPFPQVKHGVNVH